MGATPVLGSGHMPSGFRRDTRIPGFGAESALSDEI
jgi:hypothetical protein